MSNLLAIAFMFASTPPLAPADQIHVFLQDTYTIEARHQTADFRIFLTPSLEKLVLKDRRSAGKGYTGKLDFDPICNCQDFEDGHASITDIRVQDDRASAKVMLVFPDRSTSVSEVDLLRCHDRWRIDDIHTKQMSSLRKFLQ